MGTPSPFLVDRWYPMSLAESAYRVVTRGVRFVMPLVARGSSKTARAVLGRRQAAFRLTRWAREHRRPSNPLAWFHAPSVGEGLQAKAVLQALDEVLEERGLYGLQTAYTHFSPSAEALSARMPVNVSDYLPWDVSGELRPLVKALRPDLLAFTKTEVWPVLAHEAHRHDAAVTLIAATLPPSSSRLDWPTRAVLRPSMERLDAVLAIAEEDAERFVSVGARREVVEVTGDPGIDSAANRAGEADPEAPYLSPFRDVDGPVLVAGSTWRADEAVLVPACTRVRKRHSGLTLVVAPHEPGREHVRELESLLEGAGWTVRTLSRVEAEGSVEAADAVLVDRVGVLAQLYTVARVAYVGGGFHDEGLHSVLEPAAAEVPVVFGPRNANSRAASDLARLGGGEEVASEEELAAVLDRWLSDEGERRGSARAAAGYIESHRGAARRTAERLADVLRQSRA